jgi:hypothetical protein
MLTPVERVLVLKGADLLRDVGPRHLLGLASVAREIEIFQGERIYDETDPSDALYIVVEGKVELHTGGRKMSEVGPGEAFGTWSLVDDSQRGHRAECVEDGLALALHRDEFYDIAAGDLALLQELVRVLAKRLRALAQTPEQARVEGEGVEKPEAVVEAEAVPATTVSPGDSLKAAALGKPVAEEDNSEEPEPATTVPDEEVTSAAVEPMISLEDPLAPPTGPPSVPSADPREP